MESCKEWLQRRVDAGGLFFPVDKKDMLRVIEELEELDKYKAIGDKLKVISTKKGAFKHLKHKISNFDHYGKETEEYLSGQINASFEFGLITVTEFWELEELIEEKYLR